MFVQAILAFVLFATLLIVPGYDYSTRDAHMARASAEHFLAYRQAVVSWARTNPGSTGTVADASLPLPLGFANPQGWTNNILGGVVYVYGTPSGGVGDFLYEACGRSPLVGIKQAGQLVSGQGATTALPGWIPDGDIVGIWVE
jgi:hypothetical protein